MKRLFNVLLACFCVSVLLCYSCDEDDSNVAVSTEMFPVGTVKWSSEVTQQQREVISDLINNMVCVESTSFFMGSQSRSTGRANYFPGFTAGKDTIFDSDIAILVDTLTKKGTKTPYCIAYYNNGVAVSPVIEVSMPSYFIGKFEITQAQWNAVMDRKPTGNYCKVPDMERNAAWYKETGLGDNVAAYNISYDDAIEFCQALNRKTGLQFRLPTEAEWECAARGGNATRGYRYSGSDTYSDVSWNYYNACSMGIGHDNYGVHPVGELAPNELGIYDMGGNVSEWVANSYYIYDYKDSVNPQGKINGDTLLLRGGSWTQQKSTEFSPGCRRKFVKSSYSQQSFLDAIAYCGFRIVISK